MAATDDRFLNLGKAVELSTGTTIRVKELSFFKVIEVLELLPSLVEVFEGAGSQDAMQLLTELLGSPKTRDLVKKILHIVSGLSVKEVEHLSTTDVLKIAAELKGAMGWEEIKELFFRVVPKESLAQMAAALQKTSQEGSSDSSTPFSQPTDGVMSMS